MKNKNYQNARLHNTKTRHFIEQLTCNSSCFYLPNTVDVRFSCSSPSKTEHEQEYYHYLGFGKRRRCWVESFSFLCDQNKGIVINSSRFVIINYFTVIPFYSIIAIIIAKYRFISLYCLD